MLTVAKVIKIRISSGTLSIIQSIRDGKRIVYTQKTAYLLQYAPAGCSASCSFCSQSTVNKTPSRLARITWPVVNLVDIVDYIGSYFSIVCIQTILKNRFIDELYEIISLIKKYNHDIPLSTTITPIPHSSLLKLRNLGIDYLGIGLDAFTPEVFSAVGKPFSWKTYMEFIQYAVSIFGSGRVYVHLIAGMGERLSEAIETMKRIYKMGARVALFKYTPPRREKILLDSHQVVLHYRILQIARTLLEKGYKVEEYIDVSSDTPRLIKPLPLTPESYLLTSGCPMCDRPFYNESPRGPIFNYPSRELIYKDDRWKKDIERLYR